MPRLIDLTGLKFGKYVVLGISHRKRHRSSTAILWKVRCECGTDTTVDGGSLRSGRSQSCGCVQVKHGAYLGRHNRPTSEYIAWRCIVERCTNPDSPAYEDYGGRGITVCDRWRHDFAAFLADMGARPSGMSIDRINNNKGYEPNNCRWATRKQQARNKRSNHLLTHNGRTQCISAWAEETGIGKTTIKERLRRGWSEDEALTRPVAT